MILAFDCGSTNHKAALFDEDLRRLADCSIPVAYTRRDAERVEIEPEKFWQDTLALIQRACATARIQPRQISTMALASQAQTFTLIDARGQAIVPFLSWADQRAQEESAELSKRLGSGFHQHCSFSSPLPQLQVSKLLWLARRLSPEVLARSRVTSLVGFLTMRLAGVRCLDPNLAAMSGLYSLAEGDWWASALSACGLGKEHFEDVVEPGTPVRARARCAELDLDPELRVIFAGNDQTAGAYANGITAENLVVTLGTALVAYRHAGGSRGPFSAAGCWGPFPGGGFYELATRDEGCAALDWAVAQLRPGDEPGFFKLAESVPAGGAFFYPHRMHTREAWVGSVDPAVRARAVLEGISFSLRELVGQMRSLEGQRPSLTAIGGGSASDFWLQILADILCQPLRRGQGDILLGAAMLARRESAFGQESKGSCFSPGLNQAGEYEQLYQQWQRLAPAGHKA